MATVRALRGDDTFSLSRGWTDYILCCFASNRANDQSKHLGNRGGHHGDDVIDYGSRDSERPSSRVTSRSERRHEDDDDLGFDAAVKSWTRQRNDGGADNELNNDFFASDPNARYPQQRRSAESKSPNSQNKSNHSSVRGSFIESMHHFPDDESSFLGGQGDLYYSVLKTAFHLNFLNNNSSTALTVFDSLIRLEVGVFDRGAHDMRGLVTKLSRLALKCS